jgi:two-component system OmpR family response regulator
MKSQSLSSPSHLAAHVLVIEDEPDLLAAMVRYLQLEGYVAFAASNLSMAEHWLTQHDMDIIVLDLGLPDGDGLAWLGSRPGLRDKGVIMTTARGEGSSRVSGVRAGADVYLVKPVQLEELTALIRNLLFRLHRLDQACWTLDARSWHLISPEGQTIKLTHSEQILLIELARAPGSSVTREVLVAALGQNPEIYDPRRMEIMVRRLRNKTKETLGYDLPLETAHRKGYAFTAPIMMKASKGA